MISIFSPYFIRVSHSPKFYYFRCSISKNLYYIIIHDDLKPLFLYYFFFAFTYAVFHLWNAFIYAVIFIILYDGMVSFYIFSFLLSEQKKKSLFVCVLLPPVNQQGEQQIQKRKMNQQNHDFSSESLSEKIAYYFFYLKMKVICYCI